MSPQPDFYAGRCKLHCGMMFQPQVQVIGKFYQLPCGIVISGRTVTIQGWMTFIINQFPVFWAVSVFGCKLIPMLNHFLISHMSPMYVVFQVKAHRLVISEVT